MLKSMIDADVQTVLAPLTTVSGDASFPAVLTAPASGEPSGGWSMCNWPSVLGA